MLSCFFHLKYDFFNCQKCLLNKLQSHKCIRKSILKHPPVRLFPMVTNYNITKIAIKVVAIVPFNLCAPTYFATNAQRKLMRAQKVTYPK